MKASNYILPTTKEDPADAVVASHKLMIRAGLVRKSSSGLYHFLPMGLRILKKIEAIVRDEMDKSGALEFELPILTPADIWQQSGRWEKMGKEMFRINDRHDVPHCLGPTHEESFTSLLKPILKSYKDLPKNVYQIHTKFRDEIRPRFGVIRSREFIMKDAYSFHIDDASLDETYQLMRKTYRQIFNRCGLSTIPVQADSGAMGGSGSEEFMVISPIGEDTLAINLESGYAGNVEKTPVIWEYSTEERTYLELEKVSTPNVKSIEEVSKLLQIEPKNTIKAVLLKADEKYDVVVFIRGDREVNPVKVNNQFATAEIRPLSASECENLGIITGFTGPILEETVSSKLKILFDKSIDPKGSYVVGANETDAHIRNFVLSRDLKKEVNQKDFCMVEAGDPCPISGKPLSLEKGIEVGHIFKLGTKYTKAFDIKVSDKSGKMTLTTMGCYGIGLNRTMATIIEQTNDEKGIIWPISVAPFEVSLVSISKTEEEYKRVELIYESLKSNGIEVFWDDRDLGPGFKFKDSEIVGFPIRLTFGKNYFEKNEFSILNRKSGEERNLPFESNEQLLAEVEKLRAELYRALN
ncbi:MAG: proline--tRNA ligase [Leptospiraceae bacterium]|nr:proline--tRNA ligase [Leptospiraceae bacterium]